MQGLGHPQFIMLFSNDGQFDAHVKELEELYPGVPSIGCIGMSYDIRVVERGVSVIAFLGWRPCSCKCTGRGICDAGKIHQTHGGRY